MKTSNHAGHTSTVASDTGASNENLTKNSFSLSHGNMRVTATGWGIAVVGIIAVLVIGFTS